MKRLSFRPHFFLLLSLGFAPEMFAQMLAFETDRFGYSGAATKYSSLTAARAGGVVYDSGNTVGIDHGVMAIFVTKDRFPLDKDWPIATTVFITPAFYYTTADNTNYIPGSNPPTVYPKDAEGGNNRYNGLYNTPMEIRNYGKGAFMLVDAMPDMKKTSMSMSFGDYDGNVWNSFTMSLSGVDVDDPWPWGAKFALDGTEIPKDGIFIEYSMNVTAYGVQGTVDSEGQIRSASGIHPTGVDGTFSGIFRSGSDYYAFSITLDMVNEFFDEYGNPRNGDLNGDYGPSIFSAPIPEPATYAAILAGLTLLVVFVRRVRAQQLAAAA